MAQYITKSELLPDHIRNALEADTVIYVSGQPLLHVCTDGEDKKEFFFDGCAAVVDEPLLIRDALIKCIPEIGHGHLRAAYLGEYAILIGVGLETGDEYIFGVRDELNFQIALPQFDQ